MEKKIKNGATIWARQIIESDIFFWKPPEWFKIWFYLVQKVNHKETKQFRRGEGYFNWKEIEVDLKGVTRGQYNKCIKWLKLAKQIDTRKTTRGNIIFIVNYNKFQTLDNYKRQAERQAERRAGEEQGTSTVHTINKYVKYDKNEKNDNKQATACGSEINILIEKFKPINPAYERLFSNTTQRAVLERMVKQFTYEKVAGMIDALPEIVSQKYAPQISTPVQLENKLGQLLIFIKQNKKEEGYIQV